MSPKFPALLLACLLLAACAAVETPQQVYIVRHAEKLPGEDPALSEPGVRRAQALAARLATAGITRIFSTDTRRTLATAAPLAERLGLAVERYDPGQPEALVAAVRKAGGHVLVVGHSNTIAGLAAAFGAEAGPPVSDDEYDRLYLLHVRDGGAVGERQRYGE